jgi:hypothetical protein
MLLEGIKANDLGVEEDLLRGYRDRLEELERYGCNPWAEIDRFKGTIVGAAPPQRKIREKTVPAFDPGRQNTNVDFPAGFSIGPILPAFALLRMMDEGALPPRVGSVNRFPETLLTAAQWIEPHAPLWSFTAMIRQAKQKEVYILWDRAYVATLPQEIVDRLFVLLINSLVQSIQHLVANPAEVSLQRLSFAQRQVKIASELLSRLSIRCSDDQLEQLFDLVEQMYQLPLFREHHWLHDCVKALFGRLLAYGLSRAQILRRVPELLRLPVLGETNFEAGVSQTWVDPIELITWDYDEDLERGLDRSSWVGPIVKLTHMVRDGRPEARKRAVRRLAWLFRIGGLSDEESEAFGRALWSRVDEQTGLPSETALLAHTFLFLPEPEQGMAKDAFRRYVLSLDFVRVVQSQEAADGSAQSIISPGPGRDILPELLIRATVPLPPRTTEDERMFIDWSPDEAVGLLRKIVSVWEEEKQVLAPYLAGGAIDAFDGIAQRIEVRLRLVSEVLMPRMVKANDEDKVAAKTLISEIGQTGACTSFALPTLLYVDPDLREEIVRKITADITSGDPGRARSAAHGIYLWVAHANLDGIAAPPDDLLDKLINRSLSRKPAALNTVLSSLRDLLRYYPEVFSDRQLDAIGVSLQNLLEDTQLPPHGAMEREDQLAALLPVEWRPDYRQRTAQLAYRLSQAYTARNRNVPDVIRQWEQVCRDDPLPEVRAAWG